MILVLSYVWEEARVWAHWYHSFHMHLSYVRPVSCPFSSWVSSGITIGSGCCSWLLDSGHPVSILSSLRAHHQSSWNVMAWGLQYPLFTNVAVVQSLSRVWLFATPWTAARQASLSITISWTLLKLMSNESVMPSNHLVLCHPLLLLPSIFPSLRVFSNESVLRIRWPRYWSFSFGISPSVAGYIFHSQIKTSRRWSPCYTVSVRI